MTKSHRTEFYTDWETRSRLEPYTEFENRQVLKTVWEWQSVSERVLDIPQYSAYQFSLQNGDQVMLYVLADEIGRHYFFQHIGYCLANDKLPGILGIKVPARLVLIAPTYLLRADWLSMGINTNMAKKAYLKPR